MISLRLELNALGVAKDRKMYLTTALPASEWGLKHIDRAVLRTCLDYINMMAYDFHWQSHGYHAPPLPAPDDPDNFSSAKGLEYLVNEIGVDKSKIVLGLPFYGILCEDTELYKVAAKGKRRAM